MIDFLHHPDGRISIKGFKFSILFWSIVEPDYNLPNGYIGRLFTENVKHHLIRIGNNTYDQRDINDSEIVSYISKLSVYQNAYNAYLNGANVYNDNGTIVVIGPPELSISKLEIANDSTDSTIVTCDFGDITKTDEIRWSVTAPNDSVIQEIDNAIAGVDTWELTTSFEGGHTVKVETDNFGWAVIGFKGI